MAYDENAVPRPRLSIGSISHGSVRPEHQSPAFLNALRSVAPAQANRIESSDLDPALMVEVLTHALNRYVAPYCYFGAQPGDSSNFGVWPALEALEMDAELQGDILKLNAGDVWPEDLARYLYVCEVNDDGNVALFTAATRKKEWSYNDGGERMNHMNQSTLDAGRPKPTSRFIFREKWMSPIGFAVFFALLVTVLIAPQWLSSNACRALVAWGVLCISYTLAVESSAGVVSHLKNACVAAVIFAAIAAYYCGRPSYDEEQNEVISEGYAATFEDRSVAASITFLWAFVAATIGVLAAEKDERRLNPRQRPGNWDLS